MLVGDASSVLTIIGLLIDILGAIVVVGPDLPQFRDHLKTSHLSMVEELRKKLPLRRPVDDAEFMKEGDDGFDDLNKFIKSITGKKSTRVAVAPVYGREAETTGYTVMVRYENGESETLGDPSQIRYQMNQYVERKILRYGIILMIFGFLIQIVAQLLKLWL